MDRLTRDELKSLMEYRNRACVSLYMPAHRTGPELHQDHTRLKNLLRQAGEWLAAQGLRDREVQALLAPAEALVPERPFWQHQSEGLALFRSPDRFSYYRLPRAFEELVVVADRFHLKPLLSLLSGDGRFYLLALSRNEVRLLQGSRLQIHELALPAGTPRSLAEALQYDDPERQLQLHTGISGGSGAVFHGQGAGIDDTKDNLLRYCQQIDHGLHALLRDETAPLVLASVESLYPIYQEASHYPHLLPKVVAGNPEGRKAEELHARAWELLQPHFLQARQAAESFRQLAGTPRASDDLREIVPAAAQGRVAQLFTAVGVQQWGRFDPERQAVTLHPEQETGDEDLLDFAAAQTFLHGGAVYAVEPAEVPGDGERPRDGCAAVFRY